MTQTATVVDTVLKSSPPEGGLETSPTQVLTTDIAMQAKQYDLEPDIFHVFSIFLPCIVKNHIALNSRYLIQHFELLINKSQRAEHLFLILCFVMLEGDG